MSKWLIDVFKSKDLMQCLAPYLNILSICALSLTNKSLFLLWKKNSQKRYKERKSWDVILNLSYKCATELDWDLSVNFFGKSLFIRAFERLNDDRWCDKCFRKKIQHSYTVGNLFIQREMDCKTFGTTCEEMQKLLANETQELVAKFHFRNKFRELAKQMYSKIPTDVLAQVLNHEFGWRYYNDKNRTFNRKYYRMHGSPEDLIEYFWVRIDLVKYHHINPLP